MAIQAVPTISAPIYLQDWSKEVGEMEGEDCLRDDQAWVQVRQATEGDQLRISQNYEGVELYHQADGTTRELRTRNILTDRMFRAFLVLTGAANILDPNGNEVFTFKDGPNYPKFDGSYGKFKEQWQLIPPEAADAIELAVLSINRQWDNIGLVDFVREQMGEAN